MFIIKINNINAEIIISKKMLFAKFANKIVVNTI